MSTLEKQQSEYELQKNCIRHLEEGYPQLLYSATVGGVRCSIEQAVKMKTMGYKKGIPDLMIYTPPLIVGPLGIVYHGMAIEFKTARGVLKPDQKKWADCLFDCGWLWVLVRTEEDFSRLIANYYTDNELTE